MAQPAVLGIDLGSSKTMCVLSTGQIIRNELGGISTSTLVAFQGRERFIGEAAVAQARANARNTVVHVPRLLGRTLEEVQTHDGHLSQYYMHRLVAQEQGQVAVEVDYDAKGVAFPPTVLLAMLLAKLKGYTSGAYEGEREGAAPVGSYVIAVPKAFTPSQVQQTLDAAKVAGLEDVAVTYSTDALLQAYRAKHLAKEYQPGEVKHVLIVEMGHSQTSCVVAACRAESLQVLAEETDLSLGAANFDHRLFQHFVGVVQKKYSETVNPGEKKGFRLMAAMERLRKLLSTIPEAHVQAENVVENRDVNLSLRKEEFASVVAAEVNQFKSLVQRVIESSGVEPSNLSAVEISGGGIRMPVIQEALIQVTDFTKGPFGQKLDDAAIAWGAALMKQGSTPPSNEGDSVPMEVDESSGPTWSPALVTTGSGALGEDEVGRLKAEEEKMQAVDREIHAAAEVKNSVEAFILELRGAPSSKHGALIDRAVLDPFISNLENWLYSEEFDNAGLEALKAKLDSSRTEVKSLCVAYYDALAKEKADYEKALEEEAKKAEEERQANGEDEDHDNRKLKKPERMRLVMKNKEAGNDDFAHGHFQRAGARYANALKHCAKFFDLGPEDQEEVDKVRLSLYLNLAQCWLKLEKWDAAIKNCDEALKIQADNPKALYRRAVSYEAKKQYDEAQADLVKASSIAPEDKLVIKMLERVRAILKRQQEKEKQMWSKAFSS